MKAYIFPGQGAQKKGMGEALFDAYPELTAKADRILGYSIKELCVNGPTKKLSQTQYTQPALYTVNCLSYLKTLADGQAKPDFVAGHSLGEYSALFAAGSFDFETGLKLVQKRGELMSQTQSGGMAAVIGITGEQVEELVRQNGLDTIDVANFNSPGQTVLSGPKEDIANAKPIFMEAGVKLYSVLNVSAAFHSRYMKPVEEKFAAFLDSFDLSAPTIPVISNMEARPYSTGQVKSLLTGQLTRSVKWTESIRYLMGKNVDQFEEIGPGVILTKLNKAILKDATPLVVDDGPVVVAPPRDASAEPSRPLAVPTPARITADTLGCSQFKREYNLKYPYVVGAIYKGVTSKELVVKMGKAGVIGYFGAGGLSFAEVEDAIRYIQGKLRNGESYGFKLPYNPDNENAMLDMVDLYHRYGIRNVEASSYIQVTLNLVYYRVKGLYRDSDGSIIAPNRILAKVTRPEVARSFMSPAPARMLKTLISSGRLTEDEASMAQYVPMSEDICVTADSGGPTDQGVAYTLMPAMIKLREEMMAAYNYNGKIKLGAAGGIGTPESAAAAFVLGADFILTSSINQCTVEGGTSDAVKDLLEQINVQDTDYAPDSALFEIGAKVQVLKRGLFFPARANKLRELYSQHRSLDDIDAKTRAQVEGKYFKRTFDDVYEEVKEHYAEQNPALLKKAELTPKVKMALVFKWYLNRAIQLALEGDPAQRVDYQVFCGPALGAFNQWVKGTPLESWRNRHVDQIAEKIMNETAELLNQRFALFTKASN